MAAAAAGLIAEWGFGDVFDGGVRGGVCHVGAEAAELQEREASGRGEDKLSIQVRG